MIIMDFLLGVLASLVSTVIIYVCRYRLGFLINLFFFKVYPKISGEYTIYRFDISSKNEYTNDSDEGEVKDHEKLTGNADNYQLLKFLKGYQKDSNYFVKMKIKQVANKISGEILEFDGGKVTKLEKLTGKITASRVMVLNSESIDGEHHNFGTYLFNLKTDSTVIRGNRSTLCISCNNPGSQYLLLEKNK